MIEKLRYVRGVVKFFNFLQELFPETITQEMACPKKIETVEKYAEGKYRAILKWHEEGIPLQDLCSQLANMVEGMANRKIASTNYFENSYFKVPSSTISSEPDTKWAEKYRRIYTAYKSAGKTLLAAAETAPLVKIALREDAKRMDSTVEELAEKLEVIFKEGFIE